MFHSLKGNKGLLRNGDDCKTLFQVDTICSVLGESPVLLEFLPIYSWGDEGNDIAFWLEPVCFLELLYAPEFPNDISS